MALRSAHDAPPAVVGTGAHGRGARARWGTRGAGGPRDRGGVLHARRRDTCPQRGLQRLVQRRHPVEPARRQPVARRRDRVPSACRRRAARARPGTGAHARGRLTGRAGPRGEGCARAGGGPGGLGEAGYEGGSSTRLIWWTIPLLALMSGFVTRASLT